MKRVIILFCFVSIVTYGFSKGLRGEITMAGTIFDKKTKKPLTNMIFYFNGVRVETNENGKYETTITWATCDLGNAIKIWRCNSKSNRNIEIKKDTSEHILKIKSKWKKYGLRTHRRFGHYNNTREKEIYFKDIYWHKI
ncbi:MAG: hypothetical protein FVQ77_01405 [Cytophagales bacterium]|nr:hypothetical protein [Cytophagales bacterium]